MKKEGAALPVTVTTAGKSATVGKKRQPHVTYGVKVVCRGQDGQFLLQEWE